MLDLLQRLEATDLGVIARESLYGFQILVAIHILGLIFSVGALLWVDLRMIGACLRDRPVSEVYRALSKWFVPGFAVMALSGTALFAGFATSAFENPYFRVKIVVIALAGVNAAAFHVVLARVPASAASGGIPPAAVRYAGMLSLTFWAIVILCGRMMSYTLF